MKLEDLGCYTLCMATGFGLACLFDKTNKLRYIGKIRNVNYKMVIVVRSDLSMGRGKIASQCAHAAVGATIKMQTSDLNKFHQWKFMGQPKIVVTCKSDIELDDIEKKAINAGLNVVSVRDAGRTVVKAGTKTVVAIGPEIDLEVNKITERLKLL